MMEYNFAFSSCLSMEELINEIIDISDKLESEEVAIIYEFGENRDLVLHIQKDEEYNRKINKDYSNLVRICTAQNGQWVDDTEDTYVTDGALYKELKRIYLYKNLRTQ